MPKAESSQTLQPSLGSVTPDISESIDLRVKEDKQTSRSKKYLCRCCRVSTCIGFIAAYVLIRGLGLIITSFVPPLELIEFKKSFRYPEGHSYYVTYLDNKGLIWSYIINIIFCFFLMILNILGLRLCI